MASLAEPRAARWAALAALVPRPHRLPPPMCPRRRELLGEAPGPLLLDPRAGGGPHRGRVGGSRHVPDPRGRQRPHGVCPGGPVSVTPRRPGASPPLARPWNPAPQLRPPPRPSPAGTRLSRRTSPCPGRSPRAATTEAGDRDSHARALPHPCPNVDTEAIQQREPAAGTARERQGGAPREGRLGICGARPSRVCAPRAMHLPSALPPRPSHRLRLLRRAGPPVSPPPCPAGRLTGVTRPRRGGGCSGSSSTRPRRRTRPEGCSRPARCRPGRPASGGLGPRSCPVRPAPRASGPCLRRTRPLATL